jgi:glycosyltransferase involved in cell wall biosynthesis
MKNEGISVIIPSYNTSQYIIKCLDSILNQTYKNLEIIVIDDCSTDDTVKIVNKYIKKHSNVKLLINENNSGAGFSRNRGIEIAKYDLISFIDSDDYVENNYHEELLKSMENDKSDVVACDIYVRYDESFVESDLRSPACNGKVNKSNIIHNGLAASPCNKLFKKSILLNNLFPEGIMNEDVAAIIGAIIDAKKISYTTKTYYNYLQRKSSVQNEAFSFKRFDIFKSLKILEERKKGSKDYIKNLDAILYNQVIMFFIYVIPKEKSFFKRYKIIKEFERLNKEHKMKDNNHYWDFLESQSKLMNTYYKFLMKFMDMKSSLLTNTLIQTYRLYRSVRKAKLIIKPDLNMADLIEAAKKQQALKPTNVSLSVVVPNYNYENFLYQRIYSILYQKVKINELIILDDCSKDNSRDLIDNICKELEPFINIKKVYNTENSGSAFRQWEKGFKLAKSDYVWIAEADDYCENMFLKRVMKPLMKDKNINLSYCDTAFIDANGNKILKSIKSEIDIMKTGHWDKSYVNDGKNEILNYSYLNCTIANVSSVVFKNQNYDECFKLSSEYKQAGDWLFYVNVIKGGKVAYYDKTLNYYRVHGNNVTSLTKKQAHFDEIKRVHEYMRKNFKLNKSHEREILKRYEFLKKVWNLD